jgi:Vault protein inter-alpha-trypsin domain/von Willebrand factor type A domain
MIKHYLPLLDSEAHSTILATTSRTVLKQKFTNPSDYTLKECIYIFPLYDGVSVVSFTCRVGSKILRGLVKERAKAKAIFDKAVAKGETAGLLEQALEVSDVFCTKLGNIPAGESVMVEITYIGELKHHETDGIRFTIPTSIAPRYGSGPFTVDAHSGNLLLQDNGGIKITVDVSMPEGSFIKGVESPSHPIAVSMGTVSTDVEADPLMSKASATLSLGSTALEKDFVLIVQVKDIGMPKAVLECHPTIPNHRALMATLVPKFSLPPLRPEIVFVADRSGSMQCNITMLVSAMKVFLKSLPVGVKFNICSFGSSVTFLWPKSRGYTQETLYKSTSHVEAFGANMGGTETLKAIKATVERRFTDLPLEIILLTDGDIWQQEELFTYVNEQVAETKGKIRVFPLGIGNGVSHALIEGLARAGNGFAQSVQQGERLDNCVVRMLRGALSPHITDYTLEVKYNRDDDFELIEEVSEGMKVLLSHTDGATKPTQPNPKKQATISLFDPTVNPEKDDVNTVQDLNLPIIPHPKLLQAPHRIPSLFPFTRSVVYLLMSPETIQRNPTSVVLRATSAHGPLALEIPVEVLSTPGETIHQLAAKKAVQDFEEGRGWIFDAKDQDRVLIKDRFPSCFEDLVKKEAVRLGEKYQIAGRWCSFVAVVANDSKIAAAHKRDTKVGEGDDIVAAEYGKPLILYCRNFWGNASAETLLEMAIDNFVNDEEGGEEVDAGIDFKSSEKSGGARKRGGIFSSRSRRSFAPRSLAAPMLSSGFASPLPSAFMQPAALSPAFYPAPQVNNMMAMGAPPMGFTGNAVTKPAFDSHLLQYARQAQSQVQQPKAPSSSTNTAFGSSLFSNSIGFSGFSSSIRAAESSGLFSSQVVRTEVDWKTKSTTEKVLALISLQDFEGWWPANNKEVADIMGFEIPKSLVGGDQKAWVTMLVVCFLEQRMGSEEGTWELVVEKARGWLASNVLTGLQHLEKEAVETLKRN